MWAFYVFIKYFYCSFWTLNVQDKVIILNHINYIHVSVIMSTALLNSVILIGESEFYESNSMKCWVWVF
jgi:hypothetical protein